MFSRLLKLTFVVTGLALSATSFNAAAQPTQGYWSSSAGTVWKDPFGLCWRSGGWTPEMATTECDPELVKKPAPKPAAAPPPAPVPAPPALAPKPAPAPIAAPPKPAPAPMPAPVPAPVPHKVTLNADVLFDFDKASLTPADRAKLDELASKISTVNVEVVVATGHTDPLGSSAYNQKLSVRRADSVKTYLMSKGVDPDRIYAEGKGSTQQVKACPRSMSGAARIECLAPNRRVELQVIGSQSN